MWGMTQEELWLEAVKNQQGLEEKQRGGEKEITTEDE